MARRGLINEDISEADAVQIGASILEDALSSQISASSEPMVEEEADYLADQAIDVPPSTGPVVVAATNSGDVVGQEEDVAKTSEGDALVIVTPGAEAAGTADLSEPVDHDAVDAADHVDQDIDSAVDLAGDVESLVDILFSIANERMGYTDSDDDLLTGSEAILDESNVEETTVDLSASSVPDFLEDPSVGEQTGTPPPSPLVLMPSDREPEPSPTTGLVTQEIRERSEGRAPTPVTFEVEMERGLHDDDDDEDGDGDDLWDDDAPLLDQGKQSHLSLEDLEEIATQPASSTDQAAPVSANGITFPIIISW
jgi:hypothetical protein